MKRWLALLVLLPALAAANCSRAIEVPVAAMGFSVMVQDGKYQGVYPDWLAQISQATGCQFQYQAVPRARLMQMFELGQADLLIPATRTTERDALGDFVPLIRTRPAIVSLQAAPRSPLRTLGELLQRQELRVVVVRGYDFGGPYRQAVEVFHRQGRLVLESEPSGVAKALQLGLADVTLIVPSILVGSVLTDDKLRDLAERLRIENVDEFPWTTSGVYLSRQRLPEADRRRLTKAFQAAGPQVWQHFNRLHPAGSLGSSIQPIQ